ncbi:MAG TPA: hypothetical protein VMI54_01035 [Polyangiaceae bacterium]|nr:hypothetical protein [Polyangiaceae bacterium]
MRALALPLVATALTGCAATHLYSGLPPGDPPRGYESRWHSSYFFGTTEGRGPYDLGRLCPSGWSEIDLEPDFFTTAAEAVTLFLYTPTRLTIVCARPIELDAPRPAKERP